MSKQFPQDQYTKVGNINTRYWTAGDKGSAVILVHGLGGSIENWEKNINVLAQQHHVYALDLVGFGRSDKTPLVKDLMELVRFVHDFMDTLGIGKANLIGNSLGGGLVLALAHEYPQKVEKLVLVSNAGIGREIIFDFRLCSLPLVGELLVRPSLKRVARLWRKMVADSSLITPELVDLSYQLAAQPGASRALLSVMRAGISLFGQRAKYTKQVLDGLGKITMPTLVIGGTEDRIIPVAHAQITASKIPGAKLHIFEKCGHGAMFEYPNEFNKMVLDFLAES